MTTRESDFKPLSRAMLVCSMILALGACANAGGGMGIPGLSGAASGSSATGESDSLEKCSESLGTMRISEDTNASWYRNYSSYYRGLGSTVPALRVLIQQSNCFIIVERGRGMREQAIAEGLPIDLKSWTDIMQRRDPKTATFVFRPDTHVTPGVFHVVCTHCPIAEVWAEEGPKGLSFGYLYDVAVHRGLVEAFNPNATVAWEKVKTRGDKVCSFRFLIPELVTKSDPEWAQKAAGLD